MVSNTDMLHVEQAFAGRGVSGYGVGGIGHRMSEMVEEKLTVIKTQG